MFENVYLSMVTTYSFTRVGVIETEDERILPKLVFRDLLKRWENTSKILL